MPAESNQPCDGEGDSCRSDCSQKTFLSWSWNTLWSWQYCNPLNTLSLAIRLVSESLTVTEKEFYIFSTKKLWLCLTQLHLLEPFPYSSISSTLNSVIVYLAVNGCNISRPNIIIKLKRLMRLTYLNWWRHSTQPRLAPRPTTFESPFTNAPWCNQWKLRIFFKIQNLVTPSIATVVPNGNHQIKILWSPQRRLAPWPSTFAICIASMGCINISSILLLLKVPNRND